MNIEAYCYYYCERKVYFILIYVPDEDDHKIYFAPSQYNSSHVSYLLDLSKRLLHGTCMLYQVHWIHHCVFVCVSRSGSYSVCGYALMMVKGKKNSFNGKRNRRKKRSVNENESKTREIDE